MRHRQRVPKTPYERIITPLFPIGSVRYSKKQNILLGIGGNIGDVVRRFEKLLWVMRRFPMIRVIATSPILKNPPFGYLEQPYFYNAVIVIQTPLVPLHLLRLTQKLENRFGRKRLFHNAPRTLDIDIIRYGTLSIDIPLLTLPHPEALKRPSVTIPCSWIKGV